MLPSSDFMVVDEEDLCAFRCHVSGDVSKIEVCEEPQYCWTERNPFEAGFGDGAWEHAVSCYEIAVNSFPEHASLWVALAASYAAVGRWDTALRATAMARRMSGGLSSDGGQWEAELMHMIARSEKFGSEDTWVQPPSSEKPYVSVVMSARVDDSIFCVLPAGACIQRLRAVLLPLALHTREHGLDIEVTSFLAHARPSI